MRSNPTVDSAKNSWIEKCFAENDFCFNIHDEHSWDKNIILITKSSSFRVAIWETLQPYPQL